MNDDDAKVQEVLRTYAPPVPPDGVREEVLGAAWAERRLSRRRTLWRLSAAAGLLVAFVIGYFIEQAEIEASDALVTTRTPSRAEREQEELTAALTALLDGDGLAQEIRQRPRTRLRVRPQDGSVQAFRQRMREELNLLTEE